METYLSFQHFDLVTPDGAISQVTHRGDDTLEAIVQIDNISPIFVGFHIDKEHVAFNLKSTLAQLGLNALESECILDPKTGRAEVRIQLQGIGPLGQKLLSYLEVGAYVGKLFAKDLRRRVREPDYLLRMFGRKDRDGLPLLSFGGIEESSTLQLEKINGKTIAYLPLKEGVIKYDTHMQDFLPTLAAALKFPDFKTRHLLALHQIWHEGIERIARPNELLLLQTSPLHIRTTFARVADDLLPNGVLHTAANILQPDTRASGNIYEFYGDSKKEFTHVPLEFYTLEPYREHVFFSDRDQLQSALDDAAEVFKAFKTAPQEKKDQAAIFIVKGTQMLELTEKDWIKRSPFPHPFPDVFDLEKQTQTVQEFIEHQPCYPFLKAIEQGKITSQGVLFTRYFPSPLLKKLLLGDLVQFSLKGVYFQFPSQACGEFFSHEDRSLLIDLAKFAIPVYWVDPTCGKILRYTPKPKKDTGMFVPIPQTDAFMHSTVFGVYGSTLIKLDFEKELSRILQGILHMRDHFDHPLLNKKTPLSLVTGGGPGMMEVGNRVARKLGILSCANIVDLRGIEQEQNPYIDAKMTYRLDRLIERQGEFNLDFPIFLVGGYGTDFEFALEGVRRKTAIDPPTPVLLLGSSSYWEEKITANFQANLKKGTIEGSEWVSNCFYCAENGTQALEIYEKYFLGELKLGPRGPIYREGFVKPSAP